MQPICIAVNSLSWIIQEKHSPAVRRTFAARLGQTMRRWRRLIDLRLRPFGLTEATWLPLAYLAHGEAPMRQRDLAEAVGIDSSTLVRLIDALDRAGLVKRQTESDRRARILHVTPRGRAVVEQVDAVIEEVRHKVLAGIADADLAAALGVIEHVAAAVEALHTAAGAAN
jgi:MarR family transcriptional regulator for hemolysin